MISFTILTSTPAVVRNFLLNRNIVQQVTDPRTGQTNLVGLLPGLEWIEVPNPIIVTPAVGNPNDVGYVPAVMDSRHVYLVKFAHDDQDDQQQGITQVTPTFILDGQGNPIGVTQVTPAQLLNNTKFGQWVAANGARNDLNVNGTTVPAYQITGQQIWVAVDTAGLFGTWQ